jgi:hypothetical protein
MACRLFLGLAVETKHRRRLEWSEDRLSKLRNWGGIRLRGDSMTRIEVFSDVAFARFNSITEGFHEKMKLIQRHAYGFRNFNNCRLRVIAQCG